jgi:hypothetical protein
MMQTAPMPATDQKTLWLEEEIWPEILAMMHSDAFFRLWLKAQELAAIPYGPIAQSIINNYATAQLAAIRRLCDQSVTAISLPKILKMVGREQPYRKSVISALEARLMQECDETCALATQYIAHNGNPATRKWVAWGLTSETIARAQRAICEVAVVVERDLLLLRQRAHLVPVPQFDYLAEVRSIVPPAALPALREFWYAYHADIDEWVRLPRVGANG